MQGISSNDDVLQNFSDEGSSNTLAQSINISDNISERGEIVQVLTRYIMLRVRPTQRRR